MGKRMNPREKLNEPYEESDPEEPDQEGQQQVAGPMVFSYNGKRVFRNAEKIFYPSQASMSHSSV
jgi:hypothetical protein